jgi:DNA-directed RNA polymerase omega subunit
MNASRSSQIDINKCIENIGGNRFNLIIIAATRAREISQNNRHSHRHEHKHSPLTAMLEIQDGKLGIEGLLKVR